MKGIILNFTYATCCDRKKKRRQVYAKKKKYMVYITSYKRLIKYNKEKRNEFINERICRFLELNPQIKKELYKEHLTKLRYDGWHLKERKDKGKGKTERKYIIAYKNKNKIRKYVFLGKSNDIRKLEDKDICKLIRKKLKKREDK